MACEPKVLLESARPLNAEQRWPGRYREKPISMSRFRSPCVDFFHYEILIGNCEKARKAPHAFLLRCFG